MFHPGSAVSRFILVLAMAISLPAFAAGEEDTSYVLRPNDSIRVAVYEEPDLSVQIRILKTGEASFPLIGSVNVSGLSVSAAAAKIRDLYAQDYLVDPKVTLTVDEYATEFISIIGAVKSPGQIQIPVSGQLDLAAAMTTAGGLADDANPGDIQLVRASGTISTFSMADIQAGTVGRIRLESGDRIIVNRSPFVGKTLTVLGQVGRPGPIAFPASGRLDLVNAIALCGGLTELANPKKITVNRKGKIILLDFKVISQRGDQPFLLQPEDVVTVAERLF
jgi:polysaccharide export outer membrane protein